jgi:hypothetical protein
MKQILGVVARFHVFQLVRILARRARIQLALLSPPLLLLRAQRGPPPPPFLLLGDFRSRGILPGPTRAALHIIIVHIIVNLLNDVYSDPRRG